MKTIAKSIARRVTERATLSLPARNATGAARTPTAQRADGAQPATVKAQSDNWWNRNRLESRAGLSLDTAKTALLFEAVRRLPAVREARNLDPQWQAFTGIVWNHRDAEWSQLAVQIQDLLLATARRATFLPPVGFCYFPRDSAQAKQDASLQTLRLPSEDNCDECVEFVRQCRRIAMAGFTVCAVNTMRTESIRFAAAALETLPRTFRWADFTTTILEKTGVRSVAVSARAEVAAPIRFSFPRICRELERFDATGEQGTFMRAVRL